MKRLLAKLVQGLTTALASVGAATVAVSVMDGEPYWFGLSAALRVGVPAFLAGVLFFPVDAKALKSRAGFAVRALTAAFAASAAHRVLWWYMTQTIDEGRTLVPTHLDPTALLAAVAIGGAGVSAWLLQPALVKLARRPAPLAMLERLDASEGLRSPASRVRL
jgi:hypothetical protein